MSIYAYMFEIRGIQSFLFSSGKLKDLVAGSELIDFLCKQPLREALKVCGLEGYDSSQHSPRCAGGSFYLLIEDRDKAVRLSHIWPLIVEQLLPGIEQVAVLSVGSTAKDAVAEGLNQLRSARNYMIPQLPAASPLAKRNPRTGSVAVQQKAGESLDLASSKKRVFKRPDAADSLSLTGRFSENAQLKWPDNFEDTGPESRRFPMAGESHIAIVHADGNGLGEVLRVVNAAASGLSDSDYIRLYRSFSDGLEQATVQACQQACESVLESKTVNNIVPARPVVLGGDDLTLLVRADLALPFTEAFTQAFEQASSTFLTQLRSQIAEHNSGQADALPQCLTVCAGMSFIKPSQPFAQSYQLAESLCDQAKKASRNARTSEQEMIASSLSFHWVQSTLIEDAEALYEQEKVVRSRTDSTEKLALGLKAYRMGTSGAGQALPSLNDLYALAESLFTREGLNRKRLRKLATLLHLDLAAAEREYVRWRELAHETAGAALADFDRALTSLLNETSARLPANKEHTLSPLADLLVLIKLIDRSQGDGHE